MRKGMAWATALLAFPVCRVRPAESSGCSARISAARGTAPQTPPLTRISLEEAIRLALQHNHALLAARSTILQNQAQETTANLRPNPVLSWDSPIFSTLQSEPVQPRATWKTRRSSTWASAISSNAAKNASIACRLQKIRPPSHAPRLPITSVSSPSISPSNSLTSCSHNPLSILPSKTIDSFQKTVDISESRYKAGDMSEGDLLKIKLQLLQFQSDVFAARLSKVQALAALRQYLGFESVPDTFDVEGTLDYKPVHAGLDDLKALALRSRPDLQEAQLSVTAAHSQESLAEANGKRDLNASFNYTHTAGINSGAFFFNIELPIFDRNQGEIARTRYAITQSQELASEAAEQVMSDVVDAYEALRTNDQIVQLYRGGYVDAAKKSRDITEYAYKKGAASLLDFLDAERTYRSNQLAYRQALASYMTALEQMRAAVGTRSLP